MRISDWSSDVCSSDLKSVAGRASDESRSLTVHSDDRAGVAVRGEGAVIADGYRTDRGRRDADLESEHSDPAADDRADVAAGDLADDDLVHPHHHRAQLHAPGDRRSEEHTSELQSLMRISYAVF